MNPSPSLYTDLAASGHRVPIATHLVLHELSDADSVLTDGPRLGEVVRDTARRYGTPLAIPLMDLKIEKEAILRAMGIPKEAVDAHHFQDPPTAPEGVPTTPRMNATCAAISHVAESSDDLLPMGMCIGPFSLMTKMVDDPITAVYMAGTGADAEDDDDVALIEACHRIALDFILEYIDRQADAGAKAMIVCEPAANMVYFSPNQLAESEHMFERFVLDGLTAIKDRLAARGVDFILHNCGELTDGMVTRFGELGPRLLSLGGSRRLWEDARLVPDTTVLYGNLPSKRFYAPELTAAMVERDAVELLRRMREAEHPFILGSECDILSVPGSEREIQAKVDALMGAGR